MLQRPRSLCASCARFELRPQAPHFRTTRGPSPFGCVTLPTAAWDPSPNRKKSVFGVNSQSLSGIHIVASTNATIFRVVVSRFPSLPCLLSLPDKRQAP